MDLQAPSGDLQALKWRLANDLYSSGSFSNCHQNLLKLSCINFVTMSRNYVDRYVLFTPEVVTPTSCFCVMDERVGKDAAGIASSSPSSLMGGMDEGVGTIGRGGVAEGGVGAEVVLLSFSVFTLRMGKRE